MEYQRKGVFADLVYLIELYSKFGAATKSRTRDLLITSQLLYHG